MSSRRRSAIHPVSIAEGQNRDVPTNLTRKDAPAIPDPEPVLSLRSLETPRLADAFPDATPNRSNDPAGGHRVEPFRIAARTSRVLNWRGQIPSSRFTAWEEYTRPAWRSASPSRMADASSSASSSSSSGAAKRLSGWPGSRGRPVRQPFSRQEQRVRREPARPLKGHPFGHLPYPVLLQELVDGAGAFPQLDHQRRLEGEASESSRKARASK